MIKQSKNPNAMANYKISGPDAKITDGVLRSDRFKDIYFSSENGLAEARHVFVEGTNLAALLNSNDHLVIAETGFGTGLNFLAVMDLVEKSATNCTIDYISFEAYPLDKELAFEARKPFSELQRNSILLKKLWPEHWACTHHRLFLQDRIHLHLHYGDALLEMKQLNFKANIWFLDGFSPAKNKELWTEKIFTQISRLSASKATIASFSVAALVKDGLRKVGFKIEKKRGFGKKREMLTGYYTAGLPRYYSHSDKKVIIIGAGIAGASIAHGLRATNIAHIVVEGSETIASGASGNPVGLQGPQLMAAPHPSMQMSLACFSYARELAFQHGVVLHKGLISLHYPEKQGKRQRKMAEQEWPNELVEEASSRQLSQIANLAIEQDGFFQSAGQLIDPSKFTKKMLNGSEVLLGVSISSLVKTKGRWELTTTAGSILTATDIVLCIGAGLPKFLEKFSLPSLNLQVTSGQLSFLPKNTTLNNLSVGLQFGGYLTPMINGKQVLGASFDLSATTQVTQRGHKYNISLLPDALQKQILDTYQLQGRVSKRLASQDRWPLVGDWHDTIHLFSALGSRGLTNAPLLGLILARKIADRPPGLEKNIMKIIDPHRFAIRATRTKSRRKSI